MPKKYQGVGKDFGGTRAVNIADPTTASDAATKSYVDNLVNGLVWHQAIRATVATNITISNPGTAVFDGVTLVSGERLLLRGQTTASQNGPWIFNGSGVALTRPLDFPAGAVSTSNAGIVNATFFVQEGTASSDTAWTLTTNGPITVDTTSTVFTQFGGGGQSYTASLGVALSGTDFRLAAGASGAGLTLTSGVLDIVATDTSLTVNADSVQARLAASGGLQVATGLGVDSTVARVYQTGIHSAGTAIAVTHSLGKQFGCPHIYITSTGEEVECDVVATSTTVTTFTFATSQTANTLTFVIHA